MVTPVAPSAFFPICQLPGFVDTVSNVQRSAYVEITPELAAALLSHNDSNRNLRSTKVREMVNDMKQGNFTCSHQGIAFYEDGSLADGQHRLHAVVSSGITVVLQVTLGIDRKSASYIDMGTKRTESDVWRIADSNLGWVNTRASAMVNVVQVEFSGLHLITSSDKREYLAKYEKSFQFAMAKYSANTKGLCFAGISTAFALAHIAGCPEQKLADAADLLAFGLVRDTSDICANTMFALRNHLLNKPYRRTGTAVNHETLYATGIALRRYLDGKAVSRINVPNKFPFHVYDILGNIVY